MEKSLPFFNWSLKKAKDTEPDSFFKARLNIIFTILLFALLKASIVVGVGSVHEQWRQVGRAAAAFVFYIVLMKVLLYRPARMMLLSHLMLQVAIILVFTNIFLYAHKINLVTIQFVFMIMLASFYVMGSLWGLIYSIVTSLPVLLFFIIYGNLDLSYAGTGQELASPGYEIIVVLNFVSMIVSHYLFYEALNVNIKEKEKLNQQLQVSVGEATKLAASRANFLSTISHELRTPLNSVVGITELLLDDKPEERQKENLKILQFSALDLLSLINNVLDFNKIDSDKLVLENVPIRLAEFMQNICAAIKIKATDKHLDFILDIDEQLANTIVISDPTRLSQIIYNLVGNAIKFTSRGSITVKLACANQPGQTADVLFSITDTGTGIHPDKHEAIFELFTQAEANTTRKYGGTGLGLSIVKQVLALFNSSIQLESSPGKGSRFFFTISFEVATEAEKIKVPESAQEVNITGLKILIAEDSDINRFILKKQLDNLSVSAVTVENGRQAFEAWLADDYDAIFMDLHMPELNGYETIKQIRGLSDPEKANAHIIAFTASVTEQENILAAGFNDYLYKPVNKNELREKLEGIALNIR